MLKRLNELERTVVAVQLEVKAVLRYQSTSNGQPDHTPEANLEVNLGITVPLQKNTDESIVRLQAPTGSGVAALLKVRGRQHAVDREPFARSLAMVANAINKGQTGSEKFVFGRRPGTTALRESLHAISVARKDATNDSGSKDAANSYTATISSNFPGSTAAGGDLTHLTLKATTLDHAQNKIVRTHNDTAKKFFARGVQQVTTLSSEGKPCLSCEQQAVGDSGVAAAVFNAFATPDAISMPYSGPGNLSAGLSSDALADSAQKDVLKALLGLGKVTTGSVENTASVVFNTALRGWLQTALDGLATMHSLASCSVKQEGLPPPHPAVVDGQTHSAAVAAFEFVDTTTANAKASITLAGNDGAMGHAELLDGEDAVAAPAADVFSSAHGNVGSSSTAAPAVNLVTESGPNAEPSLTPDTTVAAAPDIGLISGNAAKMYTEAEVKMVFLSEVETAGLAYLRTTVWKDRSSALAIEHGQGRFKLHEKVPQMGWLKKADDDWDASESDFETFDEYVDKALGLDVDEQQRDRDFYWKVLMQEAYWVMHSVMENCSIEDARSLVSDIEERRSSRWTRAKPSTKAVQSNPSPDAADEAADVGQVLAKPQRDTISPAPVSEHTSNAGRPMISRRSSGRLSVEPATQNNDFSNVDIACTDTDWEKEGEPNALEATKVIEKGELVFQEVLGAGIGDASKGEYESRFESSSPFTKWATLSKGSFFIKLIDENTTYPSTVHMVNHADRKASSHSGSGPNCKVTAEDPKDNLCLVKFTALRRIAAGEELTYDYQVGEIKSSVQIPLFPKTLSRQCKRTANECPARFSHPDPDIRTQMCVNKTKKNGDCFFSSVARQLELDTFYLNSADKEDFQEFGLDERAFRTETGEWTQREVREGLRNFMTTSVHQSELNEIKEDYDITKDALADDNPELRSRMKTRSRQGGDAFALTFEEMAESITNDGIWASPPIVVLVQKMLRADLWWKKVEIGKDGKQVIHKWCCQTHDRAPAPKFPRPSTRAMYMVLTADTRAQNTEHYDSLEPEVDSAAAQSSGDSNTNGKKRKANGPPLTDVEMSQRRARRLVIAQNLVVQEKAAAEERDRVFAATLQQMIDDENAKKAVAVAKDEAPRATRPKRAVKTKSQPQGQKSKRSKQTNDKTDDK